MGCAHPATLIIAKALINPVIIGLAVRMDHPQIILSV
jgi:hypothetical protein